jgi:hypothetical protein
MFPKFLPYVVDERDLSSVISEPVRYARIEATAFPGTTRRYFSVVVYPDSAGPETLVLLDQDFTVLLSQRETDFLSFDTSLFINHNGRIQVGRVAYNPTDRSVTNVIAPPAIWSPIFAHPSPEYVVFTTDSTNSFDIRLGRFNISWATPTSTLTPAFSDNRNVGEVHAVYQYTPGGSPRVSVFIRDQANQTYRRTVDWITFNPAVSVTPWINLAAPGTVAYQDMDFRTLQDTPDGLLYADGTRLIRVSAESGSIIDKFDVGENSRSGGEYAVVFDPAGEFYLLFDTKLKILYKVAPWW